MKKIVMALCSAMLILACSLLTPSSVCAAERSCTHEFNSIVGNQFCYLHSDHTYYSYYNGVYTSHPCHIVNFGSCEFLKCGKCDYVDTTNPINFHSISITHSACGQ